MGAPLAPVVSAPLRVSANELDVVGLVAAGTLAVGAVGALCQRVLHVGPQECVMRAAIGIPCPLCGLSTVGVKLTHLDLVGAVRHDPIGVTLLAVLALLAAAVLIRPHLAQVARVPRLRGAWAWAVPGAVVVAHWIATLSGAVMLAPIK